METGSLSEVSELQERVEQLQTALETRIVVEQAKGVLAERFHLTVDDAFLLLRYAARSSRTNLHELAREIVVVRATPRPVPPGRAGRRDAASSVAPICLHMRAPCVLASRRPSHPVDEAHYETSS